MATLNDLPVEIHIQILSYLNWQSKYRCSIASKAWRNILLAHGQDVRLADCRHYERTSFDIVDPSLRPNRPGFHTLFQQNLMCYMELSTDGDIASIAFGPRIRALLKPVKIITPTMQYPIIASPGYCFLLNDPIFERTPDLPDDGTGFEDPRRLSLEMSVGDNYRRYQVRNKVWLFSEEPRLDKITVKEFLDLVVENLRERDSSGWSPNRKRVRVTMRKSTPFLVSVFAELFEVPQPKPKEKRMKRPIAFGQRSRLAC